jgi:hypothetical protein
MKSHIVAPLMLLASLSALSSCTSTTSAPVNTPVSDTSPQTPVLVKDTGVMTTGSEISTPANPVTTPASTGTGTPSTALTTKTDIMTYTTPAGSDSIEFSLTIDNGVITSVMVTPKAENGISKMRQESFSKAISSEVVGKKIADLHLSAVGGSSLTTGAFNQFIAKF